MSFQRALIRSSRPVASPIRSQVSTPLRRRLASTHSDPAPGLHGVQDNAFNRERAAVKQHAAETSDLWRKLSIYVVVPVLAIASANAWVLYQEHQEHEKHLPPLEERPQYPYMNVRKKSFPWGSGDETLFWNPKVNYHKKDE
ncbi:MAG: hypothetical protein M4579_007048 [Chaenotheca gracillima]|nr:MAG: hypothetical protein M4579_007048 [Chaenotheca gracillima]